MHKNDSYKHKNKLLTIATYVPSSTSNIFENSGSLSSPSSGHMSNLAFSVTLCFFFSRSTNSSKSSSTVSGLFNTKPFDKLSTTNYKNQPWQQHGSKGYCRNLHSTEPSVALSFFVERPRAHAQQQETARGDKRHSI